MVFGRPRSTGEQGERLAEAYLRRRGYRTLERNTRLSQGEIDRIMLAPDGRTIVFVEVKARMVSAARSMPRPEANITAAKRTKLLTLARLISRERAWNDRAKRIDVVAVEFFAAAGTKPYIRHFENAVRG